MTELTHDEHPMEVFFGRQRSAGDRWLWCTESANSAFGENRTDRHGAFDGDNVVDGRGVRLSWVVSTLGDYW